MIKFNELRITPDNRRLIIDVEVDSSNEQTIISDILVNDKETFKLNGPNEKFAYHYSYNSDSNDSSYADIENDENVFYYNSTEIKEAQRVRLVLCDKELGTYIKNNMFFIYVITSNGVDSFQTLVTAVNMYPIYKKALSYTKTICGECKTPEKFIDFILRIKALNLYLKTSNYIQAIKYWDLIVEREKLLSN